MQDGCRTMGKANSMSLSKMGTNFVWLLLTGQCYGKVR
jgi:hypothetical protein